MRKRSGYKMLFVLVCLLVALMGCSFEQQERDALQSDADVQDRPLLILHNNNELLLAQFEKAYPEIESEAVDMSNLGSGDPYETVRAYTERRILCCSISQYSLHDHSGGSCGK